MLSKRSSVADIGSSWQERNLWCLEITNKNIPAEDKTGIGVFANIHGGERESASSAMYTAWWLTLCSGDDYVKGLLDNYIIYVIPVINPDGYEQSFINNNRPNLRPRDLNGDGVPFSDPYADIDGDGFIATIYRGKAGDEPSRKLPYFGMESPDWDGNGILGDDPRNGGIDMNRTFNYQWNRFDIETVGTDNPIGSNAWSSAGPAAASEPEVQAVQQFIDEHNMAALTSLHTGIQCVLYPWCYRPYDANDPKDAEIPFMKETAAKMAQVYQDYTGRGFYSMSSNEDYATSAEMIDYSFGRYNIHSYTIEVYSPGKSESGDINDCMWENNMPEAKWVFYAYDEIQEKEQKDQQTGRPQLPALLSCRLSLCRRHGAREHPARDLRGCGDGVSLVVLPPHGAEAPRGHPPVHRRRDRRHDHRRQGLDALGPVRDDGLPPRHAGDPMEQ